MPAGKTLPLFGAGHDEGERLARSSARLALADPPWLRGIDLATPRPRDPGCRSCPLGGEVRTTCMEGYGRGTGGALLVVSTPTGADDGLGGVSVSGLTSTLLQEAGRHYSGPLRVAHAVACAAGSHPEPASVYACRPHLAREVEDFAAERIVALGEVAVLSVFGHKMNTLGMRRGWATVRGRPALAIMAPGVAQRNRIVARWWRSDLEWALRARVGEGELDPESGGAARVLLSPGEVEDFLRSLRRGVPTVVDAEWRGKTWGDDFELLCVGLCQDAASPAVVPWPVARDSREALGAWLEDPSFPKDGHFVKEDRHALWRALGADLRGVDVDTLVLARLRESDAPAGLKSLAWCVGWGGYAGAARDEAEDEADGKKDFGKLPPDDLHRYNSRDLVVTHRTRRWLVPRSGRVLPTWENLFRPAWDALGYVERWGFKLSEGNVRLYDRWLSERIARIEAGIRQYPEVPPGFNPGSDRQKSDLLFNRLKIPANPKWRNQNGYSVADDVLAQVEGAHPVVAMLREYGTYRKQRSTYGLSLLEKVGYDGRVHCTYRTVRSGRLGCVAKGTPVEVLRDVRDRPRGVPIEDVRPGDWAYTYDDRLRLVLRRVIASRKSGRRKVLRIYWQGQGNQHRGHVDVTEEHPIRLTTGEYVRADGLRLGDRVMALSRATSAGGYARLYPTGGPEIPREHRSGIDFDTLKAYAVSYGIDLAACRKGARPRRRSKLRRATYEKRWNHRILGVEELPGEVDVYDLEIEGTHNFIAGELCVHNSKNPNMQNVTSPEVKPGDRDYGALAPEDMGIWARGCWVAEPGNLIVSVDYAQMELRVAAMLSGDEVMAAAFESGYDFHRMTAAAAYGIPPEAVNAGQRREGKCFHPDTEALTPVGWRRIGDLRPGEPVAQAVPAPGGSVTLEWAIPTDLSTRMVSAEEGLIHLRNEGIDLRVTPNHRMLRFTVGTRNPRVSTPEEFASRAYYWANAGHLGGTRDADPRLLRLAVAVQADGSYSGLKIRLGFTKKRKIERLRSLLRPGEASETVRRSGVTYFTLGRELSSRVRALLNGKSLPWSWLSLRPDLRTVILGEAEHWDGHRAKNWRAFRYYSKDQQSLDVLQALAAVTGRKTRQCRHLLTVRAKGDTRGGNLVAERIAYEGPVSCLSVPSTYVLVRDGGVPVVTGQSINFALVFGMDEYGLSKTAGIPLDKATLLLDSLLSKYVKFAAWRHAQMAAASTLGEVVTRWGDWVGCRNVWQIGELGMSREAEGVKKHARNISLNDPIQRVANYFSLASLAALVSWIVDEGVPARVVATVHDELTLEVPERLALEVGREAQRIMVSHPSGVVRLKADLSVGPDWGHVVPVKG